MTVKHASHFSSKTQTENIRWINFTKFPFNWTRYIFSTIKFKRILHLLNYYKNHECFDSKRQIIIIVIII